MSDFIFQAVKTEMAAAEVSVVIPSYNHEKFIAAAVDSVLRQTISNIELIVVDDGSIDGSMLLLEGLARNDSRLKVVQQKNAGSHAAINHGMQLASAPWIAILNSDDLWSFNRLEVMLREARHGGGDFLFSDIVLIDGDGEPISDGSHWWNISIERIRQRVVEHGVSDGLLYGNMAVSTSNFLFRKDILQKVGWFRGYRYNLDWDFVLRCIFSEDISVQFVPQYLLRYRLHGNNAILGGMPLAAIEAQVITRRIYREHYGAPESLILSHRRHDRLLRKHLDGRAKRLADSYKVMTADRDRLESMLVERQSLLESERKAKAHHIESLVADLSAMQSSRDELGALLVSRQAIVDEERSVNESRLAYDRRLLEQSYRNYVNVARERDIAACRATRLAVDIFNYHGQADAQKTKGLHDLSEKVRKLFHLLGRRPKRSGQFSKGTASGEVRTAARELPFEQHSVPRRVAVHVHLYYKELAFELLQPLLHIPGLEKVVITGPWDAIELESCVAPLKAYCPDIRIVQLPNKGKDVGGLIHAIQHQELLDSDYLLKIHSKKSHNPAMYFKAISTLFGMRIEDGDQWRRALIDPLVGSRDRVMDILRWFDSDRAIGMVGAAPFVTNAPDANVLLSQRISSKFDVPCGMPFVAGTMFWIRSSLLAPLLDGPIELDDFDVDSRAVEGGLEHVMERIFGALVLARGFDLLKVEP